MARKANGTAVKAAEPKGQGPAQVSVITLKGTAEFRDWLAAESKRTHIPSASIVRLGLALWAAKNGGKTPPEK
jgi:hypothetical protein